VALTFSLFILTTRQIAKETDPIGLQAVSGVMAVVLMLPIVLLGNAFDIPAMTLIAPNGNELTLLLGIGVLGTCAHLLMTWSLRYAPAATLAPMQYLEIPVATLIGWLGFKAFPNGLAAIGICITVAAGLYIIMRERAIAQSVARSLVQDGQGAGAAASR
jgi:drug/metabolite transporter (DMT)-like permease